MNDLFNLPERSRDTRKPDAVVRPVPAGADDIDARAREACDRHYAGGERDGWGRALRWETVGETERERWRRIVKAGKRSPM